MASEFEGSALCISEFSVEYGNKCSLVIILYIVRYLDILWYFHHCMNVIIRCNTKHPMKLIEGVWNSAFLFFFPVVSGCDDVCGGGSVHSRPSDITWYVCGCEGVHSWPSDITCYGIR